MPKMTGTEVPVIKQKEQERRSGAFRLDTNLDLHTDSGSGVGQLLCFMCLTLFNYRPDMLSE